MATLDHPNSQAHTQFGRSVSGVGDIDNDDVPDALIGAPRQNVGGNVDQGQALLFSGSDGSPLATLDNPNPQAGALFGASVAGVGDTNGEEGLLVGAHDQDVGDNVSQGQAFLFTTVLDLTADVDIKPGSDPNAINTKSNGQIPVAVLSTDQLDATSIDISTVAFGPDAASEAHNRLHLEDLNSDGLMDAVFHFRTRETGIVKGDEEACILFQDREPIKKERQQKGKGERLRNASLPSS